MGVVSVLEGTWLGWFTSGNNLFFLGGSPMLRQTIHMSILASYTDVTRWLATAFEVNMSFFGMPYSWYVNSAQIDCTKST